MKLTNFNIDQTLRFRYEALLNVIDFFLEKTT